MFRVALCLLIVPAGIVVSCANQAVGQSSVPVVAVPHQPIASNVSRALTAMESLGYPAGSREISAALKQQDAIALQHAVDPNVLVVVTINPEQRVSVKRGPARPRIQQAGYRPVLVKVINRAASTARLRVNSPQAGPVYTGMHVLSMQRQQQMELVTQADQRIDDSTADTFFGVEFHHASPMTSELSGLEVEYLVMLLASSEAGKREAILKFDIGDGTADLEHRSELPVLFEIEPSLPVRLSIRESGKPTIARLEFRDEIGRVFPPQAKRLAPDFFFQPHVYRKDGEVVALPPGTYELQSSRGPEYRVKRQQVVIKRGKENQIRVELDRWFNASDFGFYSGDHHIHAAGCSHYTYPTQGVTPEDMFRQVRGEGLNVGCVLTWGPCFDHQRKFFGPEARRFGTEDTLLKYDLEISGFGSQALGHVCLLNLKDQTYPKSGGTKSKGWPTWTTPVMRWAKEQGGYAGYAHSASGLAIDPINASKRLLWRLDANADGMLELRECEDTLLPHSFDVIDRDRSNTLNLIELEQAHRTAAEELPNYAIPEMNGVGAMEICVSSVAGVCDFISAMDTQRIQEWNTWYHLLNCGFPLKVSGETDFPCMSSRRVGAGRVYVRLDADQPLDYAAWCRGLAEGRSYVSDGYAHVPKFSVNGRRPGDQDVLLDQPGEVQVTAEVAFAAETPKGVAFGNQPSPGGRAVVGDTVILHRERSSGTVRGGEREVQLVVNGRVLGVRQVPADGKLHSIDFDVPIHESSWIAIRHFPQMHTNPVTVKVADRPIRASKRSARWCIDMTKLLRRNRERFIALAERGAANEAFDHTLDVLRQIESECRNEPLGVDPLH